MTILTRILLVGTLLAGSSCQKSNNTPASPAPGSLSYGDSVFYLSPQGGDLTITPVEIRAGKYFGFPEGIQLDGNTGAIDLSKSETGLRYKISFLPDGSSDTISTLITISGINFLDGFYKLSAGDSIVHPLYNAHPNARIPGLNNGSLFDEGLNCNSQGCSVDVVNGQINLAQTVRNGVFGVTPSNNDRHEFLLDYRINDKSNEAANALHVKIYYFDTINDVTQEAYDIIDSRQGTILTTGNTRPAKPRPPCIFIIAR